MAKRHFSMDFEVELIAWLKRNQSQSLSADDEDLGFIDRVMSSAPVQYRKLLEQRYLNKGTDIQKSEALFMSVAQYYAVSREAIAWVAGNYHFRDFSQTDCTASQHRYASSG